MSPDNFVEIRVIIHDGDYHTEHARREPFCGESQDALAERLSDIILDVTSQYTDSSLRILSSAIVYVSANEFKPDARADKLLTAANEYLYPKSRRKKS